MRFRHAFTMVELIIVIVVVAVLASIVIVGYQRVVANAQDSARIAMLESVSREAQALAAFEDRPVEPGDVTEALADLPAATTLGVVAANDWSLTETSDDLCAPDAEVSAGVVYFVDTDTGDEQFRLEALSEAGNIVFVDAHSSGGVTGSGVSCSSDAPVEVPSTTTTTAAPTTTTTAAPTTTTTVPPPTAPGAPTNVVATAGGWSAVTISFTAPSEDPRAPITSYQVTANPGGRSATGTASPLVVTGLEAATEYTFTVTAVNGVGVGTPVEASTTTPAITYGAGVFSGTGSSGFATSPARYKNPGDVAVDSTGNVWVADRGNHAIRKISPAGAVTNIGGGTGTSGVAGFADATGTAARFNNPVGITVDGNDNVFVADAGNGRIRRITQAGVVTTYAGKAGQGSALACGTAAQFWYLGDIVADKATGDLYVDNGDNSIRKVSAAGACVTVYNAQFSGSLALNSAGDLYVADSYQIRKISAAGVVTTVASNGASGFADGTGTAARFYIIEDVTLDGSGNIIVADAQNYRVRKVTTAGVVTTIAGDGDPANWARPYGVAVGADGRIYVVEVDAHRIRVLTPS